MQLVMRRGWRIWPTLEACLGVSFAAMSCGGDAPQRAAVAGVAPEDTAEAPEPPAPSEGEGEADHPLPALDAPTPAPALSCVGDAPPCEGDVAAPCTLRCEPTSNGCIAFSEFVPLGAAAGVNYSFSVDALGPDGQYVYLRHGYNGDSLRTFPFRWTPAEGVLSLAAAWGVAETEFAQTPDGRELYGVVLDVSEDGNAVVGKVLDDGEFIVSGGVVSVTGEPIVHLDFQPLEVSSDARVVAGVQNDRAVIWDAAGGTRPLAGGALNERPDSSYYRRVLLSGSGDAAVVNGADGQALYWGRSRGVVPVAELLGVSADVSVSHVSHDGDVLFGSIRDGVDAPPKAFRWTESGGVQWLGTLPDTPDAVLFQSSHATPDGRVLIGSVGLPDRTSDGLFRWSAETGLQRIALPQKGAVRTYVSSSGDTVIGYYSAPGGSTLGSFRWNSVTGVQEVTSFDERRIALDGELVVAGNAAEPTVSKFGRALDSKERLPIDIMLSELVPGSWQASWIERVSANGSAIAGSGVDPFGERQGWLVRVQQRCP